MHVPPPNTSATTRRYSCHECRDDAEVVILGKAHPKVVDTYLRHVRSCASCRHHDAVLRALYVAPLAPRVPDLAAQEREFSVILQRTRKARAATEARSRRRRGSAVALAATVVLGALWVAFPRDPASVVDPLVEHPYGSNATAEYRRDGYDDAEALGGLEHRAQTFARIVAGEARLGENTRMRGEGTHLAAGATFEVTDPHGLQMAIVGKLLASFEPGSVASFDAANPDVVEIGLRRGMLAIRYDRLPADPILLIRTPTAVVRVVGTVFTVAVDAEGRTSVSVLRGHVEVLEPNTLALLAEVDAGFRFDGATSTYVDVGREEVSAALPVSNESVGDETTLADGQIPTTWIVPGLPAQPEYRTLDRVGSTALAVASGVTSELELGEGFADAVKPVATATARGTGLAATGPRESSTAGRSPPPLPRSLQRRAAGDDGAGLLDLIAAEVEQSRKSEVAAALEACRSLYASPETRFRAAACLTKFQREFGDEPGAEEGLLLIGILRMDFAQDHQAAIRYFERFLKRSPEGPLAELAHYRIFLAATERGIVSDALRKGREYLQRYPEGRYVGRVIQRFPELKRSL